MPPKRGAKGKRPAVPSTPSREALRALNSRGSGQTRTPLPVKHSVSYGSPMPDLPTPSIMRSGNLGSVLKNVHDTHKQQYQQKRAGEATQDAPSDSSDSSKSSDDDGDEAGKDRRGADKNDEGQEDEGPTLKGSKGNRAKSPSKRSTGQKSGSSIPPGRPRGSGRRAGNGNSGDDASSNAAVQSWNGTFQVRGRKLYLPGDEPDEPATDESASESGEKESGEPANQESEKPSGPISMDTAPGGDERSSAPAAGRKRTQEDTDTNEEAQSEKAARDARAQKEHQNNAEKFRRLKVADAVVPNNTQSNESPLQAAERRARALKDSWPSRARRHGLITAEEYDSMMEDIRLEKEEAQAKQVAGDRDGRGTEVRHEEPSVVTPPHHASAEQTEALDHSHGRMRGLESEPRDDRFDKAPSEPPMSIRSFIEEGAIFGRARLTSPSVHRASDPAARGGRGGRGGRGRGQSHPPRFSDHSGDFPNDSTLGSAGSRHGRGPGPEADFLSYRPPALQPPPHIQGQSDQPVDEQASLRREVLVRSTSAEPQARSEQTERRSRRSTELQNKPALDYRNESHTRTGVDSIAERETSLFGSLLHKLRNLAMLLFWELKQMAVWVAFFSVLLIVAGTLTSQVSLRWYGWEDWHHNLGQFVPVRLYPAFGNLTTDQSDRMSTAIWEQSLQLAGLQKDARATHETVQKLDRLLPDLLHVKKNSKTGKLVVDAEFWHALKDHIQKDKDIMSLDDKTKDITDQQWKVLRTRLEKSALTGLAKSQELSAKMEGVIKKDLPSLLDEWFKDNHKKVNALLSKSAPALGELPPDLEEKLLSKTEKLVDKKLASDHLTDKVVTKEEFVRSLEDSLASQKAELEGHFAELKGELSELIEKARSMESSAPAHGLSQDEVRSIVNDLVRTAIDNVNLEAAARSQIATHFDQTLRHQVNYFAGGNGAVINHQLSSPSWDGSSQSGFSGIWGSMTNKLPRFQPERGAVLTAWTDPGHCWCAAHLPDRPAQFAVMLRDMIIPQHIVVEHIDPAATIDGLAMPKSFEVWAAIDKDRLDTARGFQAVHFPDTDLDDPLAAQHFVKIGEFDYAHSRKDGGIQVYAFSKTVDEIKAASDHIVIRAKTNYGSPHHTCFYRVRLYGKLYEYQIKT